MSKKNHELEDYVHLRHSAKQGESYFITIVDDNGLQTINLSNFEKKKITFGKGFKNDTIRIYIERGMILCN